jgi:predicted nucleic acid-binding protein
VTVLVDTSAWSLVLRRHQAQDHPAATLLRNLIEDDHEIGLLGIALQELLSGAKEPAQFDRLKAALAAFPALVPTRLEHEEAARLRNTCRAAGVQAATVDALIATVSIQRDMPLLTTDRDFEAIAKVAPLQLVAPGAH